MLSVTALRTWSIALAFAVLALAKPTAAGQVLCEKRDTVLKLLAHDFAEAPTAIGLVATGGVIELLTSASGSWTLLMTLPTGLSCLVASGESWASKPPVVADTPS